MMQYLFQSFNFRGNAKPYRDLMYGIGTEEICHVELMATTIATLLDGSPRYQGKASDPLDQPASGGRTPLETALSQGNIHHFLVGAQGALPVDAADNPWMGSYVCNSGNLVLDLLYNLMLESTGRLQKCRLYEMTANKTHAESSRRSRSCSTWACTPSSPTSGWTVSPSWPRSSRAGHR
jgi:Mn-containing catalase